MVQCTVAPPSGGGGGNVAGINHALIAISLLGAVHKLSLQEEGGRWSKKSTICKLLYHRKCKRRGVGGQKKPNLVNVVCERPLMLLVLDERN